MTYSLPEFMDLIHRPAREIADEVRVALNVDPQTDVGSLFDFLAAQAVHEEHLMRYMEEILRMAGCQCKKPLLGFKPNQGPRCRLCNTQSTINRKEEDERVS